MDPNRIGTALYYDLLVEISRTYFGFQVIALNTLFANVSFEDKKHMMVLCLLSDVSW